MTPTLVFDLETIPDAAALRQLNDYDPAWSDVQVIEAAQQARLAKHGSDFFPLHLQKVVVIGCVFRDDRGVRVKTLGTPQEAQHNEAALLTAFFKTVERYTPRLVSWNGSGFDLPVLHYRSLMHGVQASRYWDMGEDDPTLINDERFAPAGVLAPKGKADLAFVMHMLSWLDTAGTAAIVEFPGVLYRGAAEQKIRKYLIDSNVIDAVIQLPKDLFFGVTISTCIIVLKKNKKDNHTLFIDASAEFVREDSKNRLSPENQQKILDAYAQRQDIEHFAQRIHNQDIAAKDYNLSVSSWVEPKDTREKIDIAVLNTEIGEIVTRQSELRSQIDAIVKELESA